jgi:hypothetical protein
MGHIYENCYKLVEVCRRDINEFSAGKLAGTDTSGKYSNSQIVDKINISQRFIHSVLMKFVPEEFITTTTLTGVDSVYTLPWDFGTLIQFEDPQKRKIYPSSVKNLPTQGSTGSDQLYYRKGRTLVLNKSGVTDTNTLHYYTKPRDLHFGQAQAGSGASTLVMENTAKSRDDYYNGVIVENFTSAFESEITDFTASTYSAAITGTAVANDYYGTVSEMPEEFHFLISLWAIILLKEHPASQEKPTQREYNHFQEMFTSALSGFTGNPEDVNPVDIWADFGQSPSPGSGFDIPGQGYVIY